MLFAFLAFAASLLLGLVSGVPLTDYHSDGLGFTAASNSTYLAARFVHSSTPAACTSTNVFCLTVQIAKHAFVHVSIYGRKPVWVVNHDWVNHTPIWRTYAWSEAVAGDITYQCNGRPNPEDGARIAFGFAINGGTHVSLSYVSPSNDLVTVVSSENKSIGTRGTLETTKPWIDFEVYCKDW